jgi:hypothetical protein
LDPRSAASAYLRVANRHEVADTGALAELLPANFSARKISKNLSLQNLAFR